MNDDQDYGGRDRRHRMEGRRGKRHDYDDDIWDSGGGGSSSTFVWIVLGLVFLIVVNHAYGIRCLYHSPPPDMIHPSIYAHGRLWCR